MILFQKVLRLLRRTLVWFFGAYWVIFVGYTIKNLIQGGPRAVVAWYQHISYTGGLSFHWDWRVFLARQVAILAITLFLWFVGRRPSGRADTVTMH